MTSSVIGLRRNSKGLPKAKLASKKKGHGNSLVVSDPLQLSESQWNHYIWEVCSANQWDEANTATPAADFGQKKGTRSSPWQHPNTSHNQCFKSWTNWATKFCFITSSLSLSFFTCKMGNRPQRVTVMIKCTSFTNSKALGHLLSHSHGCHCLKGLLNVVFSEGP